ncbi:MAG: glycosyltransferase family 4 protein [Proteobacteria bacterium]|nr:glycosyltransferase family 4 protein [Pseudomonadota bacterium]MBU1596550.1 glycosyltransferase family 4 protein [Pseudomonadota bacterium]
MKKPGVFGTLDPFLETGPVLGRRVANTGFLRFLLAADPFEAYHFFLSDKALRDSLGALLAQLAPDIAARGGFTLMDRRELPERLAATRYACFHQSDCIVNPTHIARLRNAHSSWLFPVTGPIHSLSYPDYPAAFLRHLWAGATARDCVIATSRAGHKAVEAFLEHLRQGYGLADTPGPSIRRIPLGLDPEALGPAGPGAPLPGPAEKQALRRALGLPVEPALVLVLGRISHSSKMDVLPLIRALARLCDEGRPRDSVALVLAGWAEEDDPFPQSLVDIAAKVGLSACLELRPGERRKADLLAACDVFVSIADNPQETFGLTLLEAQAAGLPVVASDYDGYRDLVAHGATGLLVPTLGPAAPGRPRPDDLIDQLAPLLFDNQYHLLLAQRTAVDAPALALALESLLADPALRLRMGAAGRERVRAGFLWPQVVDRHLELWDELAALPVPDIETLRGVPHPLHLPYAGVFASYPTRTLTPDTPLKPGRTGVALLSGREYPMLYAGLDHILDAEAIRKLIFLARKGETAGPLAQRFVELCPDLDADRAAYHILWAVKHDLLEAIQEP